MAEGFWRDKAFLGQIGSVRVERRGLLAGGRLPAAAHQLATCFKQLPIPQNRPAQEVLSEWGGPQWGALDRAGQAVSTFLMETAGVLIPPGGGVPPADVISRACSDVCNKIAGLAPGDFVFLPAGWLSEDSCGHVVIVVRKSRTDNSYDVTVCNAGEGALEYHPVKEDSDGRLKSVLCLPFESIAASRVTDAVWWAHVFTLFCRVQSGSTARAAVFYEVLLPWLVETTPEADPPAFDEEDVEGRVKAMLSAKEAAYEKGDFDRCARFHEAARKLQGHGEEQDDAWRQVSDPPPEEEASPPRGADSDQEDPGQGDWGLEWEDGCGVIRLLKEALVDEEGWEW
eukprot:Hpha_TRINITY_DN28889_c0_g1::TRINITY_DN28889_c0_g1_i1::g.112527::m.112527